MNTKYKNRSFRGILSVFCAAHMHYLYFANTHRAFVVRAIVPARYAHYNAKALQVWYLRHIQHAYNACQACMLIARNALSALSLRANYFGCIASLQTQWFHTGGPTQVFPQKTLPYFWISVAPPRCLYYERYT